MSEQPASAEKDAPAVTLTASEKADLFNAACRAHSGPPTFVCRPCADAQDAVIERVISARLARVVGVLTEWGALSMDGDFVDDDDFAEAIRESGAWRLARDLRGALSSVLPPAE